MTLQIDIPGAIDADFPPRPDPVDDIPTLLLGGWVAARDYLAYRPSESETTQPGDGASDVEANIFAPQSGLRNKLRALRARRRLNRTFRRNQRAFENAIDAVAHDPAGQRELRSIWTSRG